MCFTDFTKAESIFAKYRTRGSEASDDVDGLDASINSPSSNADCFIPPSPLGNGKFVCSCFPRITLVFLFCFDVV